MSKIFVYTTRVYSMALDPQIKIMASSFSVLQSAYFLHISSVPDTNRLYHCLADECSHFEGITF